jgi:hypothetical protein
MGHWRTEAHFQHSTSGIYGIKQVSEHAPNVQLSLLLSSYFALTDSFALFTPPSVLGVSAHRCLRHRSLSALALT